MEPPAKTASPRRLWVCWDLPQSTPQAADVILTFLPPHKKINSGVSIRARSCSRAKPLFRFGMKRENSTVRSLRASESLRPRVAGRFAKVSPELTVSVFGGITLSHSRIVKPIQPSIESLLY